MSWKIVILHDDGREEGPFTEEEILDLLDAGEVTRDDWCRVPGQPHDRQIGELFQTIVPPSEGAANEVGNRAPPPEIDDREDDSFADRDDDDGENGAQNSDTNEVDVTPQYYGGEELVFIGCPSWLNYSMTFALVAVVLAGGYWAAPFGGGWLGLAFAGALLLLAWAFVDRASAEYRVTDRRVESIHGLISKTSREIRLDDIRAINVIETGLTGLLGIGTVIFSSVGSADDDVVFAGIRGAHHLKFLVRECQAKLESAR
jgi:Bacterial PH domain